MQQTHMAGEKLFVDWAGDTIAVFDAATGEEQRAHIFVAAPRGKRQRSVRRGGRCGPGFAPRSGRPA
jgi:hypothetical protein